MSDKDIYLLFTEAMASSDRDYFVAEWPTSSVFPEDSDLTANADLCGEIWDAAHITIRAIRQHTGLSQVAFATRYLIPRRTLEDWESKKREPTLFTKIALVKLTGVIPLRIWE